MLNQRTLREFRLLRVRIHGMLIIIMLEKVFSEDTQTIESVKKFNGILGRILFFNNAPILPVHIPFARSYAGQAVITDLRPENPHFSHVIRGEWALLAFVEEHKLDYGVFTDRDIFKGGKVFDADIVVFNLHSEYWFNEMLAALHEYTAKGGKVFFRRK